MGLKPRNKPGPGRRKCHTHRIKHCLSWKVLETHAGSCTALTLYMGEAPRGKAARGPSAQTWHPYPAWATSRLCQCPWLGVQPLRSRHQGCQHLRSRDPSSGGGGTLTGAGLAMGYYSDVKQCSTDPRNHVELQTRSQGKKPDRGADQWFLKAGPRGSGG